VLHGLPASPGIAVGAARRLRPAPVTIPDGRAGDPATETASLTRALAATATDVRRSRAAVSGRVAPAEAAIFDAHILFLEDDALLAPAQRHIDEGASAARAWADAVAAAAAPWDALDDPYQRARAADLRSLGDQVLRHILGAGAGLGVAGEGIVVAPDLTPAEAAALDRDSTRGVACAFGGPTSHGAILARSLGIPAVMAAGEALLGLVEGTLLALDGEAGTVTVDPAPAAVKALQIRQLEWARRQDEAREQAQAPAVTRDGVSVHVAANIAGPAEVAAALASGADGVGLLRTEFLFLASDHLPTEEEQERAYRDAAEALGGRPLTLRTLDAGADKQLPALPLPAEANPFLGVRGLRLSLKYPEVLGTQLRAALRVAADHPLRIMFPMVATVDDLRRAREAVATAGASLTAAGVATPERVELGIMVEVPSAALLAGALAEHVDFFSLGTNDLTQYVLAADRGNAELRGLADGLHPAVLLLVDRTVRAAQAAGRWVAVCGELAGDPAAIPVLIGLGVRELSMAAVRIPAAKRVVRETSLAAAAELATAALHAQSAEEVRRLTAGLDGA
jgi:phosphocarrier protein FPr